jgi:hypothetical protein
MKTIVIAALLVLSTAGAVRAAGQTPRRRT